MKIDKRGFVDDGVASLDVAGNVTVGGVVSSQYQIVTTKTLVGSGNVVISSPGFYSFAADGPGVTSGYFTGSVPSAASYPGTALSLVDSDGGHPYCLTGSAWAASLAVFSMTPGTSASNGLPHGTHLKVSKGGSVMMLSDGYYWCINAGSGTYTLTGLPNV
jgi:hypothetical protein